MIGSQRFVINFTVSDVIKIIQGEPRAVLGPFFLNFTLTILQKTSRKNAELFKTPMTVGFTQLIQDLILQKRYSKSVFEALKFLSD